MSRDNGGKATASRRGGSSLWAGILAGMMIGACLAVLVVWYLKKSPSPFVNREQPAMAQDATQSLPPAVKQQPATANDDKQRFQFYTILTDKQKSAPPAKPAIQIKPATRTAKSQAAGYEPQILQAGSFPSVKDAENLKAKLALLGVEASIQTAAIKDKGVWYRVRLGPYNTADELDHARGFLKQNGVDSTPMRGQ